MNEEVRDTRNWMFSWLI